MSSENRPLFNLAFPPVKQMYTELENFPGRSASGRGRRFQVESRSGRFCTDPDLWDARLQRLRQTPITCGVSSRFKLVLF